MAVFFGPVTKESTEIFNFCTKYLSRDLPVDTEIVEGWRFPIVTSVLRDDAAPAQFNDVTFIYKAGEHELINDIRIVGSFLPLFKPLPLQNVQYEGEPTAFYYLSVILPVGKGYHYRFLINGVEKMDPINPQRTKLINGKEWSFFFTDFYNFSNEFEEWELNLLYRLVEQIMPFRTEDAQNFINRFYDTQSRMEKDQIPIHRLDQSVGEVNYISNVLAKEERHHLIDYKICIDIIDRLLRQRNPIVNSWEVPEEMINDLYNEMASNNVPGWDYSRFDNPQYFLKVLRRHCIVGAFSHPHYGGNVGCAGWNYLKETFCIKDETGNVSGSYFNWDLAIEQPFGLNTDYKG